MPIDARFLGTVKKLAFFCLAAALAGAAISNSFFEVFSGIFLALTLFLVIAEKRTDIFKNGFGTVCGLYLLVVMLTLTQSAYFLESIRGVFRVLRCILMSFFTVYLVDDEEKLRKALFFFMAAAFLIAVDALAQGITGTEFLRKQVMIPYTEEVMRVTGPFAHSNDLGAYLSMSIFLFLGTISYVFQKGSKKEAVWYVTGTLVLGGCLLWTFSRGAWVAVAIACGLMAALKRSRAILIALLLGAALIFFLSPAPLKHRISSFWDAKGRTMTERYELWDEATRIIHERPWLGYGINTYARVEPNFKSQSVRVDNRYAHNGYLQIAAETGWIGLGAFFLVVVSFFIAAFRGYFKRPEDFLSASALSLTLGIIAFLIHSATDTGLQSLRLVSLFWLCMGLVLAAKKIQERASR